MNVDYRPKSNLNMNVVVTTPEPLRGLLKKLILIPDTYNLVYQSPDHVGFVNCNINLTNDSGIDAGFRFYISSKNIPDRVDLYEPTGMVIKANCVYIRDNIKLSTGEKIFIYTTSPDIIVRLEGVENIII